MDAHDIAKVFTYHEPNAETREKYSLIRDNSAKMAQLIEACCPQSRERSLAYTKLEEMVMWANAAIAREDK